MSRARTSKWHGLEIQEVYFSGKGMASEFEALRNDTHEPPPYPSEVRRPDWRSSSAKRLMPQLEFKAPTLRRWGAKLAVAVDRPFFNAVGGTSDHPSDDLNEGDIIWHVPVSNVLTPVPGIYPETTGKSEDSNKRLQAAETVSRENFETALRSRLRPL